ncbi:MAG TPA: amidase family protein [Acidimicrobiales bacterium]
MTGRAPSATDLADAVRRGERSAVDAVEAALAAVEAGNPRLNAFVHVDADLAIAAARGVDAAVRRGQDPGPFAGVPFGVKDLEDCAGMPTTRGSLLYADRGPVGLDSVHVARLRAAGAVPIGKTAAPEFGTLNFTKTKVFGVTRNPWDPARTPGGSSGGSAAAVSAGLVPMATASDGGGSTRIPAAFSGLVGMKPSFGRIPHPRVNASQTSVYGVMATTVRDAARHLDVTAGPDDRDRTSLPPPAVRYEEAAESLDVAGLRAAWSPDLGFAVVDPEVEAVAAAAAAALVDAAGLVAVDRPVVLTDPVRLWLSAGALDLWLDVEDGQWPAMADDVTLWVRRSLEQTEHMEVPRLARVARRRWRLEEEVGAVFDDVDVLLTPTTAVPAFAAEGPPPTEIGGRAVPSGAMATPFTMLANLCWNPAVSVPAGLTADGLPVGLQVMVRRHADEVVLRLARVLEEARPWPRHAPAA